MVQPPTDRAREDRDDGGRSVLRTLGAAGAGALVGGALAGGDRDGQPVQITVIEPGVASSSPSAAEPPSATPAKNSSDVAAPAHGTDLATTVAGQEPALGALRAVREQDRSAEPPAIEPPLGFPVAIGERAMLEGIALDALHPLAQGPTQAVLQSLGGLLSQLPEVGILLLVHSDDSDRVRALENSEKQAEQFRDYLLVSGVAAEQIVALGLGASEGKPSSVEIERFR